MPSASVTTWLVISHLHDLKPHSPRTRKNVLQAIDKRDAKGTVNEHVQRKTEPPFPPSVATMDAVVCRPVTTTSLIEHVVKSRAPHKHLVICTNKASFLRQLLHSIHKQQSGLREHEERAPSDYTVHPLLIRTLSLLRATESVHLAYCSSLSALHACLAALADKYHDDARITAGLETREGPALILVNPISLHRESTAFSAQGLSKTFAFAVEAALCGDRKLVVVECVDQEVTEEARRPSAVTDTSDGERGDSAMDVDAEADQGQDQRRHDREGALSDAWDEQIPVLNSTTKTFGFARERSFLGRTVSVADVVARWCRFERL